MQDSLHLLRTRRFLPLFVDAVPRRVQRQPVQQVDGAVRHLRLYRDAAQEAPFSAIAQGLFILPFFLLLGARGPACRRPSTRRGSIRIVKIGRDRHHDLRRRRAAARTTSRCMLAASAAMGVHSTFFGPIKYAILPQHLHKDEVLGGTGLVEAGTYIAILGGTILAGVLVVQRPDGSFHAEFAAVGVCWSP